MNIDDMRALVAVVEGGSLAQAALRLHLTQPAVTRRLQRLEESLGVTLLDRNLKPARLTAEGRSAYRACVTILRATDDLRAAMGHPATSQPLRLGIAPGVVDALLRPVFQGLSRDCPAVRLEIRTQSSLDLRAALKRRELDAAIVYLREEKAPDPREQGVCVGAEEVVVVASRALGLPACCLLEALADYPFVLNPDGCGFRNGLEHRLLRAGKPLAVAASIWGIPQQLQLIADGVGLGLVPRRMIASSAEADRLMVIEVPDFRARLSVWLLSGGAQGSLAYAFSALETAVRAVFDDETDV